MTQPTQRERVLSMLKAAGTRGVRSDTFLEARIPRVAARVLELKAEGLEITSERERQFCRYRLLAGVSVGAPPVTDAHSGETLFPDAPTAYDPWSEAA